MLVSALPAAAAEDGRYGFYRVVEGPADVLRADGTEPAQENLPLLTGDRLWTGRNARAEVVLPDGTLVRVGNETRITFEDLAESSDAPAGGTLLHLETGEVQLVTDGTAGVAAYPRVDTPNATVYVEGAGSYRIEAGGERTGVSVRRGNAEVLTRGGTTQLRAGEEAFVEGANQATVAAAGAQSGLERWGTALEAEYQQASVDPGVDESLSYSASRMDGYGDWVTVDDQRAWQPDVEADWSPYQDGRWADTPSGMTWVSNEPWGWVPYHYGSWNYANNWGWLWYPGPVYAPAWVYWYWGPSYVGWAPIGYYSHYYYDNWAWDYGFGWGVHGWAGGHVGYWNHWNFVDCDNVYDYGLADHTRYAHELGVDELPQGVIATDTRPLRNGVGTRGDDAIRALTGNPTRTEGSDLPDLTRFVAREPGVGGDDLRQALPVDRSAGRNPAGGDRGDAVARGNGIGNSGDSPRAQTGSPISAQPRGGEPSGDATGRGAGAVGSGTGNGPDSVSGVPQGRPRSGSPDADGTIASRPATPSRTAPPSRGDDGGGDGSATTSRGPEDRGGIRARPSSPSASTASPGGHDGAAVRPSAPQRTSPPADRGDAASAAPRTRTETSTPPRVRPSDAGQGNGGNGGSTSTPPRQITSSGGSGARQPSDRIAAAVPPRSVPGGTSPSTAPRSRTSTGSPGSSATPGVRSSSSPRAVPPVRRVVEGVRSSRSSASGDTSSRSATGSTRAVPPSSSSRSGATAGQPRSGSYSAPPSTSRSGNSTPPAISRSGSAPPSTSRGTTAPPSGSRGGYAAPAPSSRGTYSAPPSSSGGRTAAPSTPSRSSSPSGSASSGGSGPSRQAAPSGGSSRSSGSSGSYSSGGGSRGGSSGSSRSGSSGGSRGGSSGSSGRSRSGGGGEPEPQPEG